MKVRTSIADIILEVVTLLLLVGCTVYLFLAWPSLPDKIPMHYNFAGEIDRWGAKGEIIILIILNWILYLVVTGTEKIPQVWNTGIKVTKENKYSVYRTLKYMIKTLKLIMVFIFDFLLLATVVQRSLPGWFTSVNLILLFGDMAFWLFRLYRIRK